MKFYVFVQNNSGGSLVMDDNVRGTVIFQAENGTEAVHRFKKLIDSDRCYRRYCPCCGERWSDCPDAVYQSIDVPEEKREAFDKESKGSAVVYYVDGRKQIIDWLRYSMHLYLED